MRDSPAPFGPGRIRIQTLVERTTSSRRVKSLTACPTISSLLPALYPLAVSRKLTPLSRACLMMSRLASAPSDQGSPPRSGSPKLMQPRAMAETSSPVVPSLLYRMRPNLGAGVRFNATRLGPELGGVCRYDWKTTTWSDTEKSAPQSGHAVEPNR